MHLLYFKCVITVPVKSPFMEKSKCVDLDILATICQNKKVATQDFHHLFEHKWEEYRSRFEEMAPEGIYKTVFPMPGVAVSIYELTSKGKFILTGLLAEREKEVERRVLEMKLARAARVSVWRLILSDIHALSHTENTSQKLSGYAGKSDYDKMKSWLQARLHRQAPKAIKI